MKKTIKVETKKKCWSLVEDITYATVPSWYGSTYRGMKCSICMPKVRESGVKYPLLVWFCGGAFKVMDKDVWWPQWMEFAREGCVVASVEYRTSNEAVFPAALTDAKAAIRYLKANAEAYGIDADKVFVAGESAGGALASLVGVTGDSYNTGEYLTCDSRVRGVIDFYGLVDMTGPVAGGTQNMTFGANEQFIGVEGDGEALKREASTVCHISVDTPPFLIFHGDKDDLLPAAQSDLLYEKLCEAGVRADYYILEQEGHGADAFYQKEILDIVRAFMDSVSEKES